MAENKEKSYDITYNNGSLRLEVIVVDELIKQMINFIYESEEYKEYQRLKKVLEDNIELKNKINYLKKQQLEQELRKRNGEFVSEEEKRRLNELYAELVLDENVSGYLENERIVEDMIVKVYDDLADAVDLSLDFM